LTQINPASLFASLKNTEALLLQRPGGPGGVSQWVPG